jgi:hypothetical protein
MLVWLVPFTSGAGLASCVSTVGANWADLRLRFGTAIDSSDERHTPPFGTSLMLTSNHVFRSNVDHPKLALHLRVRRCLLEQVVRNANRSMQTAMAGRCALLWRAGCSLQRLPSGGCRAAVRTSESSLLMWCLRRGVGAVGGGGGGGDASAGPSAAQRVAQRVGDRMAERVVRCPHKPFTPRPLRVDCLL